MLSLLFKEIRHNPLLWLLVFVPAVFAGEKLAPESHTLLFVLSVLAIVPARGAAEPRHRVGGRRRRATRSGAC